MDDFQQLVTLMDCDKNFANYRLTLQQLDPKNPCLPYLGLLLTDITFACEGNTKYLEENLINMNYLNHLGSKVLEIQRFQKVPYLL